MTTATAPVAGPGPVEAGAPEAAPQLTSALASAPDINGRVAVATRIGTRRWDMRFINGVTVRLPEDPGLEPAIQRLAKLQVRTALTQRPLEMIDLRSQGRVYLRLAQSAVEPAPAREVAEKT